MEPREREVLIRMLAAHLVQMRCLIEFLEDHKILDPKEVGLLLLAEAKEGTLFVDAVKSAAGYYMCLCEDAKLKGTI